MRSNKLGTVKSQARLEEEAEEQIISDAKDTIKKRDGKKRFRVPPKSSMRNLPQYSDLNDEDFDKLYDKKVIGIEQDLLIEEKIQRMYKDFEENYDLSGMMPNDRIVLRSMIQAMIRLEDYESILSRHSKEGVTESNIALVTSLSRVCKELRDSISSAQNDLKITRKVRKSEKEESTISFLQDLKVKAKKAYYKRHLLILCPKCHTLLFSGRWTYPDFLDNKLEMKCHRTLVEGGICDGEVHISSKTLLNRGGCNLPEFLPESMK